MKNYYKILELSDFASTSDVKKQFRMLAAKHHPDRNMGSKHSEEKFREILEAYKLLSNESTKLNYDKTINSAAKNRPTENQKNPNQKGDKQGGFNYVKVLLTLIAIFSILWFISTLFIEKNNIQTIREEDVYRPNTGEINFQN